jgi:hypothetical protein
MNIRKLVTVRSPYSYAISAAITFGSALQAQALDPNIQERTQLYTTPLTVGIAETHFGLASLAEGSTLSPTEGKILATLDVGNIGACLNDAFFVAVLLFDDKNDHNQSNAYLNEQRLKLDRITNTQDAQTLIAYLKQNPNVAPEIMSGFFNSERDNGAKERVFAVKAIQYYVHHHDPKAKKNAIPATPISYCLACCRFG